MIISKTPLRMSFVGGGSDLPSFYRQFGGAVLSTSITKYIYICLNKRFENGFRISYSKTENVNNIAEIEHNIVRNVFDEYSIQEGIEVISVADIPSSGSGLGSSSSFTVGLINALNEYFKKENSKETLGQSSCFIEIDKCREPIGKQDQYAAAYGGLNLFEFHKDDSVTVKKVALNFELQETLESNILAFYLGNTRSASNILAKQSDFLATDSAKQNTTKQMVALAYEMYNDLNQQNINNFGKQLHENWLLKKSISNDISSRLIDEIYSIGLKNGAEGGKLLGAGAGGFFIFYAPKHLHNNIINKLPKLKQVNFGFETNGSQLIQV